jgi:serine protease inhibitor
VINGLGLFSAFGVIYMISRGNTELELKNYFGFQDKKHLNAGLLTIRENNNGFRDQIIIDNYLLNDKGVPSIIAIAKKLKALIFNVIVNRDYPDQEAKRVNNIIEKISDVKEIISSNTLAKSNISLISIAKIKPIWAYKIDSIVQARFCNTMMKYIRFLGKTFNHHEDAEKQMIEIPMYGETLVLGFILSKENKKSPTELKEITKCISFMKPIVLDEVLIPMIKKRFKMRLNKTLQKTGLNIVFSEEEMIGLYPEGGCIDDCLQYIDILFGTKSANKRSSSKGYRTTRKFICNRTFEFYVRNAENNLIMIMGRL